MNKRPRLTTLKPRLNTLSSQVKAVGTWRADKTTTERGYGWKWQQARERHLEAHPLCVMCEQAGRVTAANTVDHRIPHRGDQTLFWDESNWQSLCSTHHSSDKQRLEKSGREVRQIGADGWPL